MQIFKKLLFQLEPIERRKAIYLLFMIIIMALLDMIGVASILPFVTVISNPTLIETNTFLNKVFQIFSIFGVETDQQFLFTLGILVFLFLIFSLFFKALTTYMQLQFIQKQEYSIAKRLLENYLNQPYSWFLNRNSSDFSKTILSEVSQIINSGINPMIQLISNGAVASALLILLIFADIKVAILVGLTLGTAYWLIYRFSRKLLRYIGQERVKANQLRFKSISEAFGAIKQIKLSGLEQPYLNRFNDPALNVAKLQASSHVIKQVPRFALEAIAFGGILILILFLISKKGNFTDALPIIALYVFAGYRLMPALQQLFVSFASLRFVGPALDALYEDQKNFQTFNSYQEKDLLKINKSISLKNIDYYYPNSKSMALKDMSISIPVNKIVGIVGKTGSGKTTTVDLILGLLEAQKGILQVDNEVINKNNKRSWQRSIGYVPQNIYLADDTIASNIALGVNLNEIDHNAIEQAAKISHLHEFIKNELPQQYKTIVGERGIRLSGGQRQRIGIARALYHKPQLLILDEATSALDNITEKMIMEKIYNLRKDITIIIIAHRLNTVKKCDIIFQIESGQLKHQGTYEELIKFSESFRENAKN